MFFCVADEVECCRLRYIDCYFDGIEVTLVESVVDSVVMDDAAVVVEIEEVGVVHSSWMEDTSVGDVEEVGEDIHAGEKGAFQVHLVDIVDVEHDEVVHDHFLLFQKNQQCHTDS